MNNIKNIAKITLVFAVFAFTFSLARPAKAFYLEVPQSVKNLLTMFKPHNVIAQDAGAIMPPQGTYPQPPTTMQNGSQTCNVNGQEMPGSCDQYQQGTQGSYGPDPYQQGMQSNDQGMQQGGQGQGGPSPEQQARQLAEMKRNTKQMERPIKEFERMIQKVEKSGVAVSEEVKQNLAKAKAILESAKNASTMEEMQNVDMSEMGDLMQSMDEFRRDVVEKQQRIDGMRRGMRGMEQGLRMFENQVKRLAKSKVTVPTDVTENIAKLKAVIAQVKSAKTSEEIDAIDFESMQDLMQNMDESRQKLEHLSRWPQTLKDINRQLTQLQREQKRAKSIANRLGKKGLDVQDLYNSFVDAVNKLKSVRDSAVEKMAAGDGEGAFELIENDFFGQMEDVWQHFRVLMMMSNMGQFNAEFKREMAKAQLQINRLKRQKKDTSELEAILQQTKERGQEIQNMIKTKDFDEDTIRDAFDEMENIGQEFDSKLAELTGQEEQMPWEKGPQQFRRIEMNKDVQSFIPQRPPTEQAPPAELESPQPAPVPVSPSSF